MSAVGTLCIYKKWAHHWRLWAASDFLPFRTQLIYSLSSSHSGPAVLCASYAFARGRPLDPGRLRRP